MRVFTLKTLSVALLSLGLGACSENTVAPLDPGASEVKSSVVESAKSTVTDSLAALGATGSNPDASEDGLSSDSTQLPATVQNCSGGGTIDVETAIDFDEFAASRTDLETSLQFNDCVESDETLNGLMTVQLVGDSIEVNSNLTLKDFRIDSAEDSITVNGDTTSVSKITAAGWSVDSSSDSMVTAIEGGYTSTLTNVNNSTDYVTASDKYSLNLAYTFTRSDLEGSSVLETQEALVFNGDEAYPITGSFTITNDNDSSSVVLDADTGELETVMMTTSQGNAVTSETVTWDSLNGGKLRSIEAFQVRVELN